MGIDRDLLSGKTLECISRKSAIRNKRLQMPGDKTLDMEMKGAHERVFFIREIIIMQHACDPAFPEIFCPKQSKNIPGMEIHIKHYNRFPLNGQCLKKINTIHDDNMVFQAPIFLSLPSVHDISGLLGAGEQLLIIELSAGNGI
jgi:hypothetical protein